MPSVLRDAAPHQTGPRTAHPGLNAQAGAASEKPEERLLGLEILIVEDEVMLAHDLAFAMEDAGAEVIGPAYTLDQARGALEGTDFHADAAILDVDLGGRDVFPVARTLVEMGIPFLFHTGHGDRVHLMSMFPESMV